MLNEDASEDAGTTRSGEGDVHPADGPASGPADGPATGPAGDPADGPADDHPWGQPSLRVTLLPRDTNQWGTIFGGVILSQLDLAGAVEARRISPHNIVTAAVREVIFHEPVFVGDLLSFYTRVGRIGRTSIAVRILVEVERFESREKRIKVTEAEAVYVAVDESRRPIPL